MLGRWGRQRRPATGDAVVDAHQCTTIGCPEPVDPLDSLRTALLVAVGLGSCAPQSPASPPAPPAPPSAPGPSPAPSAPVATAPPPPVDTPPVASRFVTYEPPPPGQTGVVRSPEGVVHRASPERCPTHIAARACTRKREGDCFTSMDCREYAHGKCLEWTGYHGNKFCGCEYSCASDRECPEGQVCTCDVTLYTRRGGTFDDYTIKHGQCVPAECKQDSDCASGLCGRSARYDGCGDDIQFACRTDHDTCVSQADCGYADGGSTCSFDEYEKKAWICQQESCDIGRPLLVDGVARTAPAVVRDDWRADLERTRDVSMPVSAVLAEHWHPHRRPRARLGRQLRPLHPRAAGPRRPAGAARSRPSAPPSTRSSTPGSRGPSPAASPGALARPRPALARRRPRPARRSPAMVAALVRGGLRRRDPRRRRGCELLAGLADPRRSRRSSLRGRRRRDNATPRSPGRTLRWLLAEHGEPVRLAALAGLAAAERALARQPRPTNAPSIPAWGLVDATALAAGQRRTFTEVVRPLLHAVLSLPIAEFVFGVGMRAGAEVFGFMMLEPCLSDARPEREREEGGGEDFFY
jgi:hypothetical protein